MNHSISHESTHVCSSRSTRTPYWEWIRSNSTHETLLGCGYSNANFHNHHDHSEESEEDDDDYAFYYSHPERIVYHSHTPIRMARRQLRRAAENAECRSICLLRPYSDERERDSLATMVDPSGAVLVSFLPRADDVLSQEYDSFSDSGYSLESDETAAEEEGEFETGMSNGRNAGMQEGDDDLSGMKPKGGALVSTFKTHQDDRHHSEGRKLNGNPSADKPNLPTKRTRRYTKSSKTKAEKERGKTSTKVVDGVEQGIRKPRSRLSFFRLFNSDRERLL